MMNYLRQAIKLDNRSLLGFDDRWLLYLFVPLVGIAMPVIFFDKTPVLDKDFIVRTLLISLVPTILYWYGCRTIALYFRQLFPGFTNNKRRVFFWILVTSIYLAFATWIVNHFCFSFTPVPMSREVLIKGNLGSILISVLVLAFYEIFYVYDLWKTTLLEKELLKQVHLKSQLDGLRNQVNPHFLFNSLNTLTSLVEEDKEAAQRYLQKMSKVFRYVLENREDDLISLSNELEFLTHYAFLLKERFQENLHFQINVDASKVNELIAPLVLQLLVENAIKHNVVSKAKPLTIEIFTEGGFLIVRNTLQKRLDAGESTGLGLENIINRYRFFTSQAISILEEDTHFVVKIPLLPSHSHKSML